MFKLPRDENGKIIWFDTTKKRYSPVRTYKSGDRAGQEYGGNFQGVFAVKGVFRRFWNVHPATLIFGSLISGVSALVYGITTNAIWATTVGGFLLGGAVMGIVLVGVILSLCIGMWR